MISLPRALLALAIFLSFPVIALPLQDADAATVTGSAIIVDGDTMRIGGEEIRVYGIDAPETAQKCQAPKGTWDCAQAVIDAVAAMTAGKTVRCEGQERDQYGRLIARCSTDDEPDIGARLVSDGLAWAFVKYSADYIDLEMTKT